MKHKLIFEMNGQTFTVLKTQDEIIRLLSIDGVKLVSVNDASVGNISSVYKLHEQKEVSRQRKLQREKGISNKELMLVSGKSKRTILTWLSKEDDEHYQKIADIIEQIEKGNEKVATNH